MRVENIATKPLKASYKYSVYGVFGFCCLFLVAFIAWAASCLGCAAYEFISKFI